MKGPPQSGEGMKGAEGEEGRPGRDRASESWSGAQAASGSAHQACGNLPGVRRVFLTCSLSLGTREHIRRDWGLPSRVSFCCYFSPQGPHPIPPPHLLSPQGCPLPTLKASSRVNLRFSNLSHLLIRRGLSWELSKPEPLRESKSRSVVVLAGGWGLHDRLAGVRKNRPSCQQCGWF